MSFEMKLADSQRGAEYEGPLRRVKRLHPESATCTLAFMTSRCCASFFIIATAFACWAQTSSPAFEVADIKPHDPSTPVSGKGRITGGRIDLPGATLNLLIGLAYGVQENMIVGSPKWAAAELYDIVAKSPTPDPSPDVIRQMAQALLADRFKLVIRRETRDAPAYVLMRGKRPLQMQKGDGGRQQCGWSPTDDGLQRRDCQNITMAEFARQMPGLAYAGIDRSVVDETNLDGVWDFHFEVGAPPRVRIEEKGGDGARTVERVDTPGLDAGPSIFAALDRIGLQLESRKMPLPVLVVEHAEPPSGN
jgi:uncharacterized protein (TIGR03435 family)